MTPSRKAIHAPDLRVEVERMPSPGLIRPAIEAALSGRGFVSGPETSLGEAVARAVRAAVDQAALPADAGRPTGAGGRTGGAP